MCSLRASTFVRVTRAPATAAMEIPNSATGLRFTAASCVPRRQTSQHILFVSKWTFPTSNKFAARMTVKSSGPRLSGDLGLSRQGDDGEYRALWILKHGEPAHVGNVHSRH